MASEKKTVYIHLLDNCNLNCKHCYLGPPSKRNHSLSWPQIKTALSHYREKGFNSVIFLGGEASLSPFLKKAVKFARKIGFVSVGVNSNGSYPQIVKQFSPQEVSFFHFSLDGASAKTNDEIRAPGHFEKCLESIKKAKSAGFPVYVSACVTKNNLHELKDLVHLLDDLGVSRLSFNFTSFIGNVIHHPEIVITPKQWLSARETVKEIKGLKNLSLNFPEMFASQERYQELLKKGYCCPIEEMGESRPNVFANGLIFSCSLITESEELATHILTTKGITPQTIWKKLLTERYARSSCPVQEFLRDKYKVLGLDKDILPICPYQK